MHLNKYERKILGRYVSGHGYGDFGAICDLAEKGLLKITTMKDDPTLESGELRIEITDAGRQAVA